ncbi:hypothetical protein AA0111_g12890, partial [Alternaria arborescens]|uniref:hypothetical protein n=1 Tax=Alternaria arborescens TaxID=156630 RepID=UPI0010751CA6
ATKHVPLPYISELSTLRAPPIRTLIEVIIHRNASGNVQHAFRDISVLDSLFTIDEIAVIHHTDCGTLHFKEEQVRDYVKKQTDETHWAEVDKMVFSANAE